jgi:hypothetical protein
MTNKPRKRRTDSTDNLHRIFAGANIEIAPPAHVPLTDADWPYWHSIIEEYAKSDWTRHALDIVALLARTMALLEEQQRLMFAEGPVLTKADGSPCPNPRNRVVATLNGQVLALRRSLGLTARAKAGSSRDAARQREANRLVEQRLCGPARDDLLA